MMLARPENQHKFELEMRQTFMSAASSLFGVHRALCSHGYERTVSMRLGGLLERAKKLAHGRCDKKFAHGRVTDVQRARSQTRGSLKRRQDYVTIYRAGTQFKKRNDQ